MWHSARTKGWLSHGSTQAHGLAGTSSSPPVTSGANYPLAPQADCSFVLTPFSKLCQPTCSPLTFLITARELAAGETLTSAFSVAFGHPRRQSHSQHVRDRARTRPNFRGIAQSLLLTLISRQAEGGLGREKNVRRVTAEVICIPLQSHAHPRQQKDTERNSYRKGKQLPAPTLICQTTRNIWVCKRPL